MAYNPLSGAALQYVTSAGNVASGYYLKFYIANTTTPLSMATDATGGTLLVKCKLSDKGYPISNPADNSTVFIPHVNASYRFVLYVNEADADANTTANADVNIPDIAAMVGAESVGTASLADIQTSSTDTTANALMAVGAFGLGANISASSADLDTFVVNGFYSIASAAANNPTANAALLVNVRNATNVIQTLTGFISNDVWSRAQSGGVWSDWVEVYTTGNINPYKFDAAVDELVLPVLGTANSGSRVVFVLQSMSFTKIATITEVGTFKISDLDNVDIHTGITASDIAIASNSSIGVLRLNVNATAGTPFTGAEQYFLRADTGGASIVINP